MKYPQLVSTRAVNAISDWLVSRLEQLGVEAPQIYSRLLLSLLQSSVQINDPIEFSNLEAFIAHRKGSNRRYHPFDTNTIKKINAVQCLSDIVSSEQEIASIETLVDELFEKLIDIEKKSTDFEDDEQILVATLSVATTSLNSQDNQSNYSHHFNKHHKEIIESSLNLNSGATNNFNSTSIKKIGEGECRSKGIIDIETDPKKQYFRAFPALTKEMEDSFRILRRNAKSLTWPVDKYKIASLSISTAQSNITQNLDTNCNKEYEKRQIEESSGGIQVASGVHGSMNNNSLTAVGVKRKTKRRRNQALTKGKTIQNIRKSSCSGVGNSNKYRSTSPFWDTDFEGCWEMGRDLIKEFLVKQNNRNRSTSESAAYTNINNLNALEDQEMLHLRQESLDKMEKNSTSDVTKESSPLNAPVDVSFCYTESSQQAPFNLENDDDTFASITEITDASLNLARPLYKRDISGGSHEILPGEKIDDQLDFAQFKAKFDSSLEALWKNMDEDITDQKKNENNSDVYSMSSSIMQLSSLPAVAPFKENLQNFWTNYYNHHFDLTKISQTPEGSAPRTDVKKISDELNFGFPSCSFGKESTIYTSDYCSMPSKLEEIEKSSFKLRRNVDCCEEISTPINVFLQNSIWSKNPSVSAGDTDESFYKKVWNSKLKVNKQHESLSGDMDTTSNENTFNLPQYSKSKWSEGINIGPKANITVQSLQSNLQAQVTEASASSSTTISSCSTEQKSSKNTNDICNIFNIERHVGTIGNNNMNIIGIDCTDSSTTSTSTTSCASYPHSSSHNWQTPLLGQSLQPDMQSWSSSNPISLTEMYESDTNIQQQFDGKHMMGKFFVPPLVVSDSSVGPVVTLKNHSPSASGFVEYSRIKSAFKMVNHQEQIMHTNSLEQEEIARNKEQQQQRYAEDENLLTSERTHFHPIKTYADGHSFDICGALDVIEYERSQSGYLYLENERYLEYTRNDAFLAEDDATSATASNLHMQPFGSAPLYGSSNCEATTDFENTNEHQCDFVIKFRLRNCEVACQTNDEESPNKTLSPMSNNLQDTSVMEQQHPLCLIFSSSLQGMKLHTTGLACNDAIEALNKAVNAAAKAAASTRNSNKSHRLPNAVTNYRVAPTAAWQSSKTKRIENIGIDEVDFQAENTNGSSCSLNALEQWSMHEIGKKCELQGHDSNAEAHSLWGLCIACNNEFKSIPANRLLKDELQLEADEIMSDLKYMQDLYISEGGVVGDSDSDWDVGEPLDDTMMLVGDKIIHNSMEVGNKNEVENVKDTQQKQTTHEVLYKVNRLIADLLCRENSTTYVNKTSSPDSFQAVTEEDELSMSLMSPHSSQFIGSLWSCNDEHNIWQQDQPNATFKALNFFKQLNDGRQKSRIIEEGEDTLLSHLSWEHDNLAEIWQKRTPSPLDRNSSNKAIENVKTDRNSNKRMEDASSVGVKTQNKDKNQFPSNSTVVNTSVADKELYSNAALLIENNEQTKTNIAYERVQQFLAANTKAGANVAKLKISNRKRRHSASQNLFHTSPNSATINNSISYKNTLNNNNNTIANLNQFKAMNNNAFAEIQMQKITKANSTENDYDYEDDDLYTCGVNEVTDVANIAQPKQTIITCKYWTTLDPLPSSPIATTEDMVEGATTTFSCLLDKNASILKHVTMVTRPLTR